MSKVTDPTREDMLSAIKEALPGVDDFDQEAGLYWYANDNHGGQWSNLYSALSVSPYTPGMRETRPRGAARDVYDHLAWLYRGGPKPVQAGEA